MNGRRMIMRTGALAVAAAVAARPRRAHRPPLSAPRASRCMERSWRRENRLAGPRLRCSRVRVRGSANSVTRALTRPARSGISYAKPEAGVLYVRAAPGLDQPAGCKCVGRRRGPRRWVPPQTLATVTIDELTTVATAYALAQFSGPNGIAGPSPGLENAAATAFNLADPASGKAGAVVTDQDNGAKNQTLATLGTLANLVSLCEAGQSPECRDLLRLTAPPGGTVPGNTVQAVLNLVRHPSLSPAGLFALAQTATVYQPALTAPPPPGSWRSCIPKPTFTLLAASRSTPKGNVWSSNNWLPGTKDPSLYVTVLNPVGQPALGSPISGGGMRAEPGGSRSRRVARSGRAASAAPRWRSTRPPAPAITEHRVDERSPSTIRRASRSTRRATCGSPTTTARRAHRVRQRRGLPGR